MSPKDHLTILEALENLNTLVDAPSLDDVIVTENDRLIPQSTESYEIPAAADEKTEAVIKETFRVVHKYLQSFYQRMQTTADKERLVEGVGTIMVLVGEAAKKLERYSSLFKEKVTDLTEYQDLQAFYQDKIIKDFYKEFATRALPKKEGWEEEIAAFLQGEEVEEVAGTHILDDIEVVKKDHLYELFYMKNEAGHPFYTSALARMIKLSCDFGQYAKEYFGDDPLLQIKNWEDRSLHLLAKEILAHSKRKIDQFYKEALKYREMDLVMNVHKALMALMLAANSRNLIRQFSLKGCHRYFADFQAFLRQALHNREFQKFLLYPPPTTMPFFHDLIALVESLTYDLFTMGPDLSEMHNHIEQIIARIEPRQGRTLVEAVSFAKHALTETLQKHPSGPLFHALDLVRESDTQHHFDPLALGNIPAPLGTLHVDGHEIRLQRMPSPTVQEYVQQAFVIEEFTTYLRSLQQKSAREMHLIINLQDRTSWKEHARSHALEELSRQAEFADVLTVVTIAKDTDFYNQTGIYQELNDAKEFLSQWEEHIGEEASGYYFPPQLAGKLFPTFVKKLLSEIHETFFANKKELVLIERLNFIELTYLFLSVKMIELIQPTRLTFLSKDGLDTTGTTAVGLIALASLSKKWTKEELHSVQSLLFGPTLLYRERSVHPERIDRLIALLHRLEGHSTGLKSFASLFNKTTLHMKWEG